MRRFLTRSLGDLIKALPEIGASSLGELPATRSVQCGSEFPSLVRQICSNPASASPSGLRGASAAVFQARQFSQSHASAGPSSEAQAQDSQLNPLLQTPTPATGADGALQTGPPSRYGQGKAMAKLRGIQMSPKKMNHFATMIRGMHIQDALTQCRLSPKKAAKICAGVIVSARANAENNHGLEASKLMIDIINVGKGQHLKRASIHGRGKAGVRLTHFCHLEVVLKESDRRPRMSYVKPLLERSRRV